MNDANRRIYRELRLPEPLHVGRPNLGDRGRFLDRVAGIFERRWLTNDGPLVREFEAKLAAMLGVRHCVVMCNGTVALEIAIRALELKGEVLVPSFTFVATAHALQWQEITPVFCDIDASHTIDPNEIERHITPKTTGIIGVHTWGRPCNVPAIAEIAARRGLKVLFDAAHALGCTRAGKSIGCFGEAEVLSFHATKFVNSFEGGAVVTENDALAQRMRLMRNFGFAGYDNVEHVGTNGKMTEVSAAMGLTSLESADEFIQINRRNHEWYRAGLRDVASVRLLQFDEAQRHNYQYNVIELDESAAGISRDDLIAVLHAHNVLARRYFYPGCHRMQPYRSLYPMAHLWLPQTEAIASRIVVLPTGTSVTKREIDCICELIRRCTTPAGGEA
jgi:dTDP-4-amino-4,6-dideoxygalactose transaminase